jgi:hypothetical protein
MKPQKILLTVSIVLLPLVLYFFYANKNTIYLADNLNLLEQKTKSLDNDSLVIFDVDKVLLIDADPGDRAFKEERGQARTITSLYKKGSDLFNTLDEKTRDSLWLIYMSDRKKRQILVDEHVVKLIRELQKNHVKVIALTRFLVGQFDIVPAIEEWRIEQLQSKGIDFSTSFPDQEPISFNQFRYENKSPVFKKGFLFTALAATKGQLLKAFFDKIGWTPKIVVMVDDKRENLESVQSELKKLGIPFIGFDYRAAEKFPAYFDKEVAEFQMQHLINNKVWLPASQAASAMKMNLS